MQPFNPTPRSFELFCKGVVRNDVATVQQAITSAPAPAAAMLSWLEATDRKGLTPLHHVAQHGYAAVAEPILAACSVIQMPLASRQRLVQLLHSAGASAAAAAAHHPTTQLLRQHTDHHVDIWAAASDRDSHPHLYHAARIGSLPLVQRLLSMGLQDSLVMHNSPAVTSTAPSRSGTLPQAFDNNLSTESKCADAKRSAPKSALEAAIKNGSLPIVQQLLDAATPAQLHGQYGFSALSFAVTCSASLQIVQLLLAAGVPVIFGESEQRVCVLSAAVEHADADVVAALLAAAQQAGRSNAGSISSAVVADLADCLVKAVQGFRPDIVRVFLQPDSASALLTQPGFKRASGAALYMASTGFGNCTDAVQLLLKLGADVNCLYEGSTALSTAVDWDNWEAMQVLLDAGADPSIKDSAGRTAWQKAIAHGLRGEDDAALSTRSFACLLAHSSLGQRMSADELISTAWDIAGKAGKCTDDDSDVSDASDSESDWDSDDEQAERADRATRQREARHSMLSSLLKAAAAKDSTAAQAALSKCIKQVEDLHRRAKSCFDGFGECTCGCCMPQPINPDLIQRAHLLLRAMSEVWLASAAVDVAAQRSAVQHMLVSATASVKQMQHLQQQAEADSMGRREAQVALREQQLDEREQQLLRREQQVEVRKQLAPSGLFSCI